jgi:hypothetical protein
MNHLLPTTIKSYIMLMRLEGDQEKRRNEKNWRRVMGKNLVYREAARRVKQRFVIETMRAYSQPRLCKSARLKTSSRVGHSKQDSP